MLECVIFWRLQAVATWHVSRVGKRDQRGTHCNGIVDAVADSLVGHSVNTIPLTIWGLPCPSYDSLQCMMIDDRLEFTQQYHHGKCYARCAILVVIHDGMRPNNDRQRSANTNAER